MKRLPALLSIVLFSISCVASAEDTADNAGAISGRISPENALVRIIAKTVGTEYKIKNQYLYPDFSNSMGQMWIYGTVRINTIPESL